MNGDSIEVSVLTFMLILVRVTTFFAVLPFFGRKMIPGLILVGLSLSLTTLWFMALDPSQAPSISLRPNQLTWLGFFFATGSEFIIGALLGFSFGLFIYPLQIAGSYLAQEMGLSMASMSDPATQANSDVVSSLMQTVALMLFFCLDLHYLLIELLNHSLVILPIGSIAATTSASEMILGLLTQMEQYGLAMIAPIGISLFIILVILLLLTKTAPTMNIFSVGLSIRVAGGLFFTWLFLPQILNATQSYFEKAFGWIHQFLSSMT